MAENYVASGLYAKVDPDWLNRRSEEALEVNLPIIDSHHHLWDRTTSRYLFDDIVQDLRTGHNIVGTVFVECKSMYRVDGPDILRPLGEVEFVNGVAAMSASGTYGAARIAAGIVGSADLLKGREIRKLLELQIAAGGGRFRGIRKVSAWDADQTVTRTFADRPRGLLLSQFFRDGFAELASLDLSFNAFLFYHQIPELVDLARAFPDTKIVLDHIGGPIHIGSYASRRAEVFAEWRRLISILAECQNVWIKIGGLGMKLSGFDFHLGSDPPTSGQLAEAWRPYVEVCIEAFGTRRCMFESNFPPDKGSCSYTTLWNAFKKISRSFSADEKADLFYKSASRFYRLSLPS